MIGQKFMIGVVSFIIGAVVFALIVYSFAPSILIVENESKYRFNETIEIIQKNASEKGWKIPAIHRIDQSVIKAGYHSLPVAVIELCKPSHAANILGNDDDKIVTSMMPCRVSVYQTRNGKVIVSRMNTGLVSKIFGTTISETMEVSTLEIEELFDLVLKK